ncbi:sulfite exporter TauE/SafE family protein [Moraxella marmotae]|uniref:sulfite exporter TauE/SafE family protein n=1 Tax=Moraxella marmotae TaxID=3344520 RepID=UPI0035F4A2CB
MQELIQILAFAIASVLHGITGMGFPMIGTTALAFIMPLPQAVAMVALPSVVMSLLVMSTGRKRSLMAELWHYCQHYKLLAISSIIGGVIGVKLLLILPNYVLYLAMSAVTLYYVAQGFLSLKGKLPELSVPTTPMSMAAFGLLAGIIGGSTNAMSPILLMFLMSYTKDKNEIAKASNLCYLLGKVVQVILLKDRFLSFTYTNWLVLLALTAVSIGFLLLGIYLRAKISIDAFKALTYGVLLLLALKIGYSGLQGLFA